jgi:uridine kinase
VRVSRMAARDGVPGDPADPAQRRYLDAQRIYRDACRPLENADIVVDNGEPERPRIVGMSPEVAPVAHNGQP